MRAGLLFTPPHDFFADFVQFCHCATPRCRVWLQTAPPAICTYFSKCKRRTAAVSSNKKLRFRPGFSAWRFIPGGDLALDLLANLHKVAGESGTRSVQSYSSSAPQTATAYDSRPPPDRTRHACAKHYSCRQIRSGRSLHPPRAVQVRAKGETAQQSARSVRHTPCPRFQAAHLQWRKPQ